MRQNDRILNCNSSINCIILPTAAIKSQLATADDADIADIKALPLLPPLLLSPHISHISFWLPFPCYYGRKGLGVRGTDTDDYDDICDIKTLGICSFCGFSYFRRIDSESEESEEFSESKKHRRHRRRHFSTATAAEFHI
jgi:hypothetical protein